MRARIMVVLTNYGDVGATDPQLLEEVEPESKSAFYARNSSTAHHHGVTELAVTGDDA